MKNILKESVIITLILLLLCMFGYSNVLAKENTYSFNIGNNMEFCDEMKISLLNTVDEKKLSNGKIAPGTSGKFKIIVNIEKNIIADYRITFENFSSIIENLKFYYENEVIDINKFDIEVLSNSETKEYLFDWVWDYETESKYGDELDTKAGEIENLSFDIVLLTSYDNYCLCVNCNGKCECKAENCKCNKQTLPKTGNF